MENYRQFKTRLRTLLNELPRNNKLKVVVFKVNHLVRDRKNPRTVTKFLMMNELPYAIHFTIIGHGLGHNSGVCWGNEVICYTVVTEKDNNDLAVVSAYHFTQEIEMINLVEDMSTRRRGHGIKEFFQRKYYQMRQMRGGYIEYSALETSCLAEEFPDFPLKEYAELMREEYISFDAPKAYEGKKSQKVEDEDEDVEDGGKFRNFQPRKSMIKKSALYVLSFFRHK